MNQKKKNELLRFFDPMKKKHLMGSNGFNTGSTFEHELEKWTVAFIHAKKKHTVYLEPVLKKGGRPDVVCLDCQTIYEVVHSEKEASIEAKKRRYPDVFKIEVVDCR